MPQFAVLIYNDDSAHESDNTASTSDEIAICDEHAVERAIARRISRADSLCHRSGSPTCSLTCGRLLAWR